MNRQIVEAAVAKANGNMSAAARALGCAKSTVQKTMGRHPDCAAGKRNEGTLTAAAILARFNVIDRVMAKINSLPDDEFRRDNDMIALAGLTKSAWEKARKSAKVKACQVRLPDASSVYGKAKDAAVLRRRLLEE